MNYRQLKKSKGMPVYLFVLGSLLGVMGLTSCLSDAAAQENSFFISDGRRVNIADFNKEVSDMMEEAGVPGMSLAIIENDEIVFRKGYGVKQKKPNRPLLVENISKLWRLDYRASDNQVNEETVFAGASLSKTYLAYVAMELVDEGKLDLDKPLHEYLEYQRLAHDERAKLITARMVLSHSSGLENWKWNNDGSTLEILANPGEKYIYSGEGYHYLAYVIKGILQKSYGTYVNERVIEPLGLKNSFLNYSPIDDSTAIESGTPSNFAIGHQVNRGQFFGRNTSFYPAAQNHFTAEDYARLTVAMLNAKTLSRARRKDILEPRVQIDQSPVYYGPAFEILSTATDTIVSHGGDNSGYKNFMFYSPVQKRGFVMMTNVDWGKSMGSRLNDLTSRLSLDTFFSLDYGLITHLQYPNPVPSLLKTHYDSDSVGMFRKIELLKKEGKLTPVDFNGLGAYFLYYGDSDIAKTLFEEATALFPDSAMAYTFLGGYHMDRGNYKLALDLFNKAKALNFSYWDIEKHIVRCEKNLSSPD